MSIPWKEWVIDITHGDGSYCFCPYDRDTGDVIFGMNMISERCPGELAGVVHLDGQQAVEDWIEKNPDWHERFSRTQ